MKKVIEEEREYLEYIIDILRKKIQVLRIDNSDSHYGMEIGAGISKDDYASFIMHRNNASFSKNEIALLREIVRNPYFAKINLESNESKSNYYIGKNDFYTFNKHYIFDWRSTYGDIYYQKNQKQFLIKNTKYECNLRRNIQIEESKLVSVNDEYIKKEGNDSIRDIIDPFLISILENRRKTDKFLDIIKSIQFEQYEIISQDFTKNFIIQGCAGSGKTMILAHRLSYLFYNNNYLKMKDFIIVTPNKMLIDFMNELKITLEINETKQFTIEEFYFFICNIYLNKSNNAYLKRAEAPQNKAIRNYLLSKDFENEIERNLNERHLLYLTDDEIDKFKSCIEFSKLKIYGDFNNYSILLKNTKLLIAHFGEIMDDYLRVKADLDAMDEESYISKYEYAKEKINQLNKDIKNFEIMSLSKSDQFTITLETAREYFVLKATIKREVEYLDCNDLLPLSVDLITILEKIIKKKIPSDNNIFSFFNNVYSKIDTLKKDRSRFGYTKYNIMDKKELTLDCKMKSSTH